MKIFTFLPLFLMSCICLSQSKKFSPGYFVNQSGDTVKGFLLLSNPNQLISFKFKNESSANNIKSVSFDSCRSLAVNKEYFVNWTGTRGMAYVDNIDLEVINADVKQTGKIPLKLLYKGIKFSLYIYQDKLNHFFMEQNNVITELAISYSFLTDWEKKFYVVNPPTYLVTPTYRLQIISAMGGTLRRKQRLLIESTDLEIRPMVKLFKALNKN
ncbi:MAG: hypothetical protein ABIO04_07030 [Ferruginibacter sp.]